MSSGKLATIEATYSCYARFDVGRVEELFDISWSDVDDFYIKWGHLFIKMKDGSSFEVEQEEPTQIDWKRPDRFTFWDKLNNKLEPPE